MVCLETDVLLRGPETEAGSPVTQALVRDSHARDLVPARIVRLPQRAPLLQLRPKHNQKFVLDVEDGGGMPGCVVGDRLCCAVLSCILAGGTVWDLMGSNEDGDDEES